MPRTQLKIDQFFLGPEVPLGRRGCKVEESKDIQTENGWKDTVFYKTIKTNRDIIIQLLKKYGQEVFTVLKRIKYKNYDKLPEEQTGVLEKLKSINVILGSGNNLKLSKDLDSFGSEFECYVSLVLRDLYIQNSRDVKIIYPYNNPYDPDGQKYDILGGLDLTELLWIECKKPLYLESSSNPLQNVISKENIKKFYKRSYFLFPEIAIFLVDTKDDYKDTLLSFFTDSYLNSSCYFSPKMAESIVLRLHGFIYFCRILYNSNKDYYNGIQTSICQVLHDARKKPYHLHFSGEVFK